MACIGLINGYRRCTTAPKYAPKTVKKRHEITSYTARYGENHFYDARYILLLLCKPDTIYSGFDTKYALDMYRKSAYNRKYRKRKAKALRLCRRGETEREVKRMIRYIVKRSGDKVSFDARKIKSAIFKANTRIAAERMSDADLNELTEEVLTALEKLPEQIDEMLKHKENIQFFASKYFNASDMYFIGRNVDYAASLEASLKLKEISYIHSEAYAAGELKHGPISLIEDGTLVIALATDARLFDKMMSNIKEVKARGAVVLGVATEDKKEIAGQTDMVFYIPKTASFMLPSLSVIPMQLFAYYVASMKGCDIDKPRNLAKSVTVE